MMIYGELFQLKNGKKRKFGQREYMIYVEEGYVPLYQMKYVSMQHQTFTENNAIL